METRNKPCQKCTTAPCVTGLRFCKECAVRVKREMIASGYLGPDEAQDADDTLPAAEPEEWREAWGSYVDGAGEAAGEAPDADAEVAPDVEGDDVLYGFQEVERP